jgi:15-cis-phytoene synthase
MNSLAHSYEHCRSIVRRSRSNFALAFRLLSRPQREAMNALYAFMRETDDITDVPGDTLDQLNALIAWRTQLDAAFAGQYSHPIHAALHDSVRRFGIDLQYLHEVIDGVTTDLEAVNFATFEPLRAYCYRVASAVGLACLPIWGCTDARAKQPAEACGIAFQLTNILRDLREDAERGRLYLPHDELQRFGCMPANLGANPRAFRELMEFQIERAKRYYDLSRELNEYLAPSGRAILHVMWATYRELLNEIERRPLDVLAIRVRLTSRRKAMIYARAWPIKWGWG